MKETPIQNFTNEQTAILKAAQLYVREITNQKSNVKLVLHNDLLSDYLEEEIGNLAVLEGATLEVQIGSRLAGLFYPLGFRFDRNNAVFHSQEQFRQFSKSQQVSAQISEKTLKALDETGHKKGETLAGQLLCDAITSLKLETEINNWPGLALLEKELFGQKNNRLEAAQLQLQELLNVQFLTTAARKKWGAHLGRSLIEQKRKVEKLLRNQNEENFKGSSSESAAFADLESGTPVRAAQTYFRAVYRNHINLSAIADNKANIMISVNAVLISILITFLSYRNIAETQPAVLFPVVIFLVAGLASLIFAVLSARPKVTSLSTAQNSQEEQKKNLMFFGNFVALDLEAYETAMDEILQDSSLIYGNMVRDMYFLGKVLDRKYRFLTISYNIFMVGLVVTVGLFLITLFFS